MNHPSLSIPSPCSIAAHTATFLKCIYATCILAGSRSLQCFLIIHYEAQQFPPQCLFDQWLLELRGVYVKTPFCRTGSAVPSLVVGLLLTTSESRPIFLSITPQRLCQRWALPGLPVGLSFPMLLSIFCVVFEFFVGSRLVSLFDNFIHRHSVLRCGLSVVEVWVNNSLSLLHLIFFLNWWPYLSFKAGCQTISHPNFSNFS